MWGITEAVQSNNLLSIWSCLTSGIIDASSLFHNSTGVHRLPENLLSFAGHFRTFAGHDFRRTGFSLDIWLNLLSIWSCLTSGIIDTSSLSHLRRTIWPFIFAGHLDPCWTFEDFLALVEFNCCSWSDILKIRRICSACPATFRNSGWFLYGHDYDYTSP